MSPDELEQAIERTVQRDPQREPSHARPIAESIGCSDAHARAMADAHNLVDDQGMLHCWNCRVLCTWHVSLHCDPCRRRSIAQAPERRHQERQAEIERRNLEFQAQAPRVANGRSFR